MAHSSLKRFVLPAALAVGLFAVSHRGAEAKEGPFYHDSCATKQSRKFLRGVGNTLFFWAEIPKNIFVEIYATDPFTGFICGLGEGIKEGGCRLTYGIWETVTFYSPGDRDYQPYIEPEFVLMNMLD